MSTERSEAPGDGDGGGCYDYDRLKDLAKELSRPFKSVFALATKNDPFTAGVPWRRARARWFADLWEGLQIPAGMHDRRIHYLLVSQETPILYMNGEPYANTDECWQNLHEAVRDARYLDLIPPGAIADHRTPEAIIFHQDVDEQSAEIDASEGFVSTTETDSCGLRFYLPTLTLSAPTVSQAYHVEVWCEKSTIQDVLVPLGERYRINVVPGIGEMTATACESLVARACESGLPVRILYVSDFDPGGMSMPVAAARKIEFFAQSQELDIQVRPVALTHDQCVRYRLPRTPIKESETRGGAFEARYGEGATELDALEAVRPGELQRILVREIERYYDPTLGRRLQSMCAQVSRTLDQITAEVHAVHAAEIAELERKRRAALDEVERLLGRISSLESEFEQETQPLLDAIHAELEEAAPDSGGYEWPESREADEDLDPMFDSTRTYLEQIGRYREHQGKEADPVVWNRRQFSLTCIGCGGTFVASNPNAKACGKACNAKLFRDRKRQSGR